ncbi:hypothetical protein B0H34DRAFT_693093 [Crassisporium funariophilum]|nr:hypothetical protein B0H34DRAFT_693093 [Crassisporium funariophilum]
MEDNASTSTALFTSLLGLKGSLRVTTHGCEHKPHIILKRVDQSNDQTADGSSKRTVRFSFFAHKRFEVKPGKEILFAVASEGGSEEPLRDIALVFEGDVDAPTEASREEEVNQLPVAEVGICGQRNMQGLPPKLRKSMAKVKSYANYISNEPASALGFPGWTSNSPGTRVYCSASAQTEDTLSSPSLQAIPTYAKSRPSEKAISETPVHLPSPVSADNGRDLDLDNLAQLEEETDDVPQISQVERSLSPMELSSASSSPESSTVPLPNPLPSYITGIHSRRLSPASSIASSTNPNGVVSRLGTPPATSTQSVVSVSTCELANVAINPPLKTIPTPTPLRVRSPELATILVDQPDVAPMDVSSTMEDQSLLAEVQANLTSAVAISDPPNIKAAHVSLNTGDAPLKRVAVQQNAVASSSRVSLDHVQQQKGSVLHTQALSLSPIGGHVPGNSGNYNIVNGMIPADSTSFSKPPVQGQPRRRPSTEPPASPVPPSAANPLGIRPSANPTSVSPAYRKVPPVGPLTESRKKRFIVGGKWTAARGTTVAATLNNATSSSVTPGSSLSSLPSTSSISSLTSSPPTPLAPSASAGSKAVSLSRILSYGTPSPPPPPASSPPPPLPPQSAASKWRRISGDEEGAGATTTNTVNHHKPKKPSPRPTLPKGNSAAHPDLKLLDKIRDTTTPTNLTTAAQSVDDRQGANGAGRLSEKLQPRPGSTTSTSSAAPSIPTASTSTSTSTKAPATVVAMTHPLPPKPLPAQGSSYRPPLKRERSRSPDLSKQKRTTGTDWPPTYCSMEQRLQGSEKDLGIQKIVFNSDGTQFALICADRTLRIWENKQPPAEIARLSHNTPIVSIAWMERDNGVVTLCQDGMISTWKRAGSTWLFAKLDTITGAPSSNEDPMSMAYTKDRIAVSIPSLGVRLWLCINGTWRQQREIIRSGVVAVRFIQDGNALIGACRDGVIWYCEVPNGTLRMHCFLNGGKPTSLDINPSGSHLLVGEDGGKAQLVTLRTKENKGSVEQKYTSEKLQFQKQKDFHAVFATKGQAILHGSVNGCALVWDRKKGTIVYGLKHSEDDVVQAAATFDGRPGLEGWMVTGTKQGRLYWWPQPVAAAPSHSTPEAQRKRQKLGA